MVNGGHIDSTDPQIISRWLEFLDLYVAEKVPKAPSALGHLILDSFTSFAAGTSAQAPLPPVRFTTAPNAGAWRRRSSPGRRPGSRSSSTTVPAPVGAGDPQSTYAAGFATWPPEGATTTYYLGAGGSLTTADATASGRARRSCWTRVCARPPASPRAPTPGPPSPRGTGRRCRRPTALAFQTTPFATDTTIVGPATLDLWVRSPAPVVDLQATVTEVRPSASQEEYVTSGFLRSSNQVDLPTSTALLTAPTYLAADAQNLSPTTYRLVRIPIDPIVHTFRAGTELRVVLSAPGGDRPSWEFATLDHGQTATVGFGAVADSTLVVNMVHGVTPPPTLPACGTLRGEPCRTYQAEGNQA